MIGIEERKSEAQPHMCAKGNMNIAISLVKMYTWYVKAFDSEKGSCDGWEYKICDYDSITGMVKGDPKFIGFYGFHNGKRCGHSVSFHQHTHEFEKELGTHLGWLESNGYIIRSDRKGIQK
jgi:hypothetical protein